MLDAVRTELGEHGYDGLTMDAVAARAGVHRATVYRRRRDVDGLPADVLEAATDDDRQPQDTGSLQGDLAALNHETQAALTAGPQQRTDRRPPHHHLTGRRSAPVIAYQPRGWWMPGSTCISATIGADLRPMRWIGDLPWPLGTTEADLAYLGGATARPMLPPCLAFAGWDVWVRKGGASRGLGSIPPPSRKLFVLL
ncbi:helix-turn-helix domain-containing protein [Streptosporangium canum]|uniref:TetR/AcrR family transcriptional regulator n=1 Tax=Streptosporangium canum TaxID=324952 RepID=UPI0034322115